MTTLQIMAHVGVRGQQEVSVVENPRSLAPEQFRSLSGTTPALLGSDDVLRVAWRLVTDEGYRPVGVRVIDRRLSAVDDALNDELADEVVHILRNPPENWDTAERRLNAALDGYYVLNIELRDRRDGGQVQVSQKGILTTEGSSQVDKLRRIIHGRYLA